MDHKPITSISTQTRDTFVMCRNTQAAEIRAGLKARGVVSGDDHEVATLVATGWEAP